MDVPGTATLDRHTRLFERACTSCWAHTVTTYTCPTPYVPVSVVLAAAAVQAGWRVEADEWTCPQCQETPTCSL